MKCRIFEYRLGQYILFSYSGIWNAIRIYLHRPLHPVAFNGLAGGIKRRQVKACRLFISSKPAAYEAWQCCCVDITAVVLTAKLWDLSDKKPGCKTILNLYAFYLVWHVAVVVFNEDDRTHITNKITPNISYTCRLQPKGTPTVFRLFHHHIITWANYHIIPFALIQPFRLKYYLYPWHRLTH